MRRCSHEPEILNLNPKPYTFSELILLTQLDRLAHAAPVSLRQGHPGDPDSSLPGSPHAHLPF
jgi:hypothetical protein